MALFFIGKKINSWFFRSCAFGFGSGEFGCRSGEFGCRSSGIGCILLIGDNLFVIMSNFLAEAYLNESTRLNGGNYANWKLKVLTVLEGINL